MRRGGRALLAAAFASLVLAASAGAQTTPNPPWPQLLPPAPGTSADVQPGPVARCREPTIRCVDDTLRIFRRFRARLGCDHRAVFVNTYLLLTEELKRAVRRRGFFDDRRYLIWEITEFANYYFRTLSNSLAGRAVPEAWQVSFDAARSDGVNGGQDMLLGINAHVQRDMPYVVAAMGVRFPDGTTRKPDHDRVNDVLNAAYEAIVRSNARRYDPILFTTNADWDPLDNIAGLEAVKGWREGVWRNAERLMTARTPAERSLVEASIEGNAATWARLMAAPQTPGYRASRDAYCAAHR
jgi:uncharacterized protein DUF5995